MSIDLKFVELTADVLNPFRALKPHPILTPNNFVPKTGFQL